MKTDKKGKCLGGKNTTQLAKEHGDAGQQGTDGNEKKGGGITKGGKPRKKICSADQKRGLQKSTETFKFTQKKAKNFGRDLKRVRNSKN